MSLTKSELLSTHFKKTATVDIGKVSMDADMLNLLLAIDARLPLSQVAAKAGLSPEKLPATAVKLIKLNLIQPAARKAPAVGAAFIQGLKANMIKAVGPFGEFIVQDALADTGYSENDIPINMAADIILQLSEEIADEDARRIFKEEMIKLVS